MNTVREFQSQPVSPALSVQGSLWTRTAKAIKTAWKRLASTTALVEGPEIRMTCSPVTKIPAITVAGKHTRPARKAPSRMAPLAITQPSRRPGVQGRWKTSDRVATL